MNNEQIEKITRVFRTPIKDSLLHSIHGYRFTDQDGNILRKKATRPYTHMAVKTCYGPSTSIWTTFHQSTPKPERKEIAILRIIKIEEKAPTFVVKGIVNEGWADAALTAADASGARLVKFEGTEMTFEGLQVEFTHALNLVNQGQLP